MPDYVKSTVRKMTSNAGHFKGKSWKHQNVNFKFHYHKFSQQRCSTVSAISFYYNRLSTDRST